MEKKILLLGHKGMLGQMVEKYFSAKGHEIITLKNRFEADTKEAFIDEVRAHPDALVINAIGKIKQKTTDNQELLWSNAILPLTLRQVLPKHQRLVHPSTDCVFKGDKGRSYTLEDEPDAMDDYGWSKRLAEVALEGRPNTLILRVSIIGPDENPEGKGLLNWFLQQPKGAHLKGFSNHLWNGITTLEWCKQLTKFLATGTPDEELIQLGTRSHYTKFKMLNLFQNVFQTQHKIAKVKTDKMVDRRLNASHESVDLETQLEELSLMF